MDREVNSRPDSITGWIDKGGYRKGRYDLVGVWGKRYLIRSRVGVSMIPQISMTLFREGKESWS